MLRFRHVSNDAVFGSLDTGDAPFVETHAFQPDTAYSASKASSDLLVHAHFPACGLPTLTTHCSNNDGPYTLAEKLIPSMIKHALVGNAVAVCGDRRNVRDLLYTEDHCAAIRLVLENG
jgi:dTDP-glucose 4,6-dehydratase